MPIGAAIPDAMVSFGADVRARRSVDGKAADRAAAVLSAPIGILSES